MDRTFLYNYATFSLNRAKDLQTQILQIDLDIKLRKLSNKSSFRSANDSMQLNYLHSRQVSVVSERDSHISTALAYAIEILLDEMQHKVSGYLSVGSMLINNIQSFLFIYNIKPHISLLTTIKLSELSVKLAAPELSYNEVASKLEELRHQLY